MQERCYSDVRGNLTNIDESSLSFRDRLGLAYCRLLCWEWDEFIGPKPDGFDTMEEYPRHKWFGRRKRCRVDYTHPAMTGIESILGEAECSRYWWLFAMGETEETWRTWYLTECFRTLQ